MEAEVRLVGAAALSYPSRTLKRVTDTLLRSLREHLLDESEPLAGLLRKCLLLGAETGSEALREWARNELNGYGEQDDVPTYRKIRGLPISMDSINGNMWAKNQIIDRLELPGEAQKYVSEWIPVKQPVEELEQLAGQKQLSFKASALAYAQSVWNEKLGPFQQIVGLSYVMSGSVLAGILGQVRTKLVDVVADLTADTPLSELPKKGQVDAAVNHRIGDIYNTTVQTANAPVAIGREARSTVEGLTVDDALRLLDQVQRMATGIADAQRAELLDALTELRTAVQTGKPETGDVVKKAGKLRAAAAKLGIAAVTLATDEAVKAVTDLAVSGVFG